jgi:arylsulfatase A-like enzyme
MYDDFAIPEAIIGEWVGAEDEPQPLIADRIARKADRITPQILQRTRRHYYGQITHIDYQLGRLFGELKARGLYDNTVIVITSDHGEHLGDHGLFAKSTFLESSARVPIILRLPREHGIYNQRDQTPALTADIAPTLLEFAGLAPDAAMDGLSLLQLPQKRIVFGETLNSVFATDGEFKFIHYFANGAEQLFDLNRDADDLVNLAGQSAYAEAKAALKAELIEYLGANQRPAVVAGELLVIESTLDVNQLRAQNTAAWRGPLRYGQGYG